MTGWLVVKALAFIISGWLVSKSALAFQLVVVVNKQLSIINYQLSIINGYWFSLVASDCTSAAKLELIVGNYAEHNRFADLLPLH